MGQNVNKNEILSADVNIIPKVSNSDLVDCSKVILYANLGSLAIELPNNSNIVLSLN